MVVGDELSTIPFARAKVGPLFDDPSETPDAALGALERSCFATTGAVTKAGSRRRRSSRDETTSSRYHVPHGRSTSWPRRQCDQALQACSLQCDQALQACSHWCRAGQGAARRGALGAIGRQGRLRGAGAGAARVVHGTARRLRGGRARALRRPWPRAEISFQGLGSSADGSRRRRGRDLVCERVAATPRSRAGSDRSRRRRGRDLVCGRVAATPRPRDLDRPRTGRRRRTGPTSSGASARGSCY